MNKRIQELAEKAGLSYMPSNYPDMTDLYKGADFELEKFAELIVRECIEEFAFGITDNAEIIQDRFIQCRKVAKHFGIE